MGNIFINERVQAILHSEDIEIPFNIIQCCHCMLNDFCVMAVHDFHVYINSQIRN